MTDCCIPDQLSLILDLNQRLIQSRAASNRRHRVLALDALFPV